MELIGKTKITRLSAKKNIAYPMLRFPKEYSDYIGKYARIYRLDETHFIVEIMDTGENGFKTDAGFKTIVKNPKPEGHEKTQANQEKNPKGKMPRAGFEPATFRSSVEPFSSKEKCFSPKELHLRDDVILDYSKCRSEFIEWLKDRNLNERYAMDIIIYLDKYLLGKSVSSPLEISKIRNSASSKKMITVAIRVLLNFCEEMDLLDGAFINKLRKPLKTVHSNPDNYVPGDEQVWEAYWRINPKYRMVFRLFLYSGIRATEAIMFFGKYTPKKVVINGNIARYPLFSIRKSKRAYFVYFPVKFVEEIEQITYTKHGIGSAFQKAGLPSKYLRKWNYNFLIMNNVPESVADFIQGRAPVSVGSMHYLARVKQADYWYAKVADILAEMFDPHN